MLLEFGENTSPLYLNIKTAAHNSASFVITRGYHGSNTASIHCTGSTYTANGGYPNLRGIRVIKSGTAYKVIIRLFRSGSHTSFELHARAWGGHETGDISFETTLTDTFTETVALGEIADLSQSSSLSAAYSRDTLWADSAKARFGNASDLQIYHDGSNSYIQTTTTSAGDLYIKSQGSGHDLYLQATDDIFIRPQNGENGIVVVGDGEVKLYHNNNKKLETTSSGADVTGTLNLDNLTINGAQGSDGQVLTSTGSGIAWEDASGGSSGISQSDADNRYVQLTGSTMTGDLVMQDEMINFAAGNPELPNFRGKRSNTRLNDRDWDTEGAWSYTTFENSTTDRPRDGLHNGNGLLTFNTHSGDGTNNYMHQMAFCTSPGTLHHRNRSGGSWGSWYEIAQTNRPLTGYLQATAYHDASDTSYYLDPASTGTSLNVAGNVALGGGTLQTYHSNITSVLALDDQTSLFTRADQLFLANNCFYNSSDAGTAIEAGKTSLVQLDRDKIRFYFTASASAGATVSFQEKFRLNDSGNATIAGTLTVGSNTVIDTARRGYFASLQHSGVISFLDGSQGTTGSGAQGINVRHLFASGSYNTTPGQGDVWATSDMRAPIFYDYNDTAYYVDAASRSNLAVLDLNEGQVWDATTQGTSKGSLHIDPNTGTDNAGGAITFGASDASGGTNAQAGIYIRSDGSYGTRMHFSTTDSYATGSKTAMNIQQNGQVNITRSNLIVNSDVRTPIFYDSNNTSYFLDPNGTSSLYGLSVNQTISGTVTDSLRLVREDNRTISPSELAAGRLKFGFTSFANNNSAPYADFLHLRSYTDSSGGNDTLIMVKKANPSGVRVWNQSWGSSTAYSNYIDLIDSGSNNQTKTGHLQSDVSFRAPKFFDSSDTAYFVSPASTSILDIVQANYFRASTTSTSDPVLRLTDAGVADYDVVFPDTNTYRLETTTSSTKTFRLHNAGSGNFKMQADEFVKTGGTSSQYLMADGSVSTSANDSTKLPLAGGTMTGTLNAKTLQTRNTFPEAHNSYDLGTSGVRYRNVYAVNLYGDGSNITGISASGAGKLTDGGNASTHPGTSCLLYTGQTSAGADVLGMPTVNNANGIITLNKHAGEYNSQLGFSSNGKIYYRNFNNTAINNTTAWTQIAFISDANNKLPLAGGTMTGTIDSHRNDSQTVLLSGNSSASNADQFRINHSFANVEIRNLRGNLNLFPTSTCNLGYGTAIKLATTSGGVSVTGSVSASSTIGNLAVGTNGQQMEYGDTGKTTLRFDADRWRLFAGAGSGEVFTVQQNGRVGINDSTPDYTLDVNGNVSNISIYASHDVAAYSDARVKTDVETIPNALDKVNKLRGVTFKRTDEGSSDKRMMGVIAQEVKDIIPEVVNKRESDGHYSVSYGNMVGVLIEAVKELTAEVNDLKEQLKNK
tara:strand:- start:1774 stop:6015 length:4242 start_codon:yes stop_codon:yes gene_type:complete